MKPGETLEIQICLTQCDDNLSSTSNSSGSPSYVQGLANSASEQRRGGVLDQGLRLVRYKYKRRTVAHEYGRLPVGNFRPVETGRKWVDDWSKAGRQWVDDPQTTGSFRLAVGRRPLVVDPLFDRFSTSRQPTKKHIVMIFWGCFLQKKPSNHFLDV